MNMDFLNQPVSPVILPVLLLLIFVIIKLSRKKSRADSAQFLSAHPDAATLYLYAEDLPANDAEIECLQGTVSRVFGAKDLPTPRVQKGAACYVLPGPTEINGTIVWTKDYYLARKHSRMQAHLTFQAEAGRAYAAVFHTQTKEVKFTPLDGEKAGT